MVRTLIGVDSTGAGCIKIMKNSADDPRTTPDSQRSKFLYNSKFALQSSVADIERCNVLTPGSGFRYEPPGTTVANYQRCEAFGNSGGPSQSTWLYRNTSFPKLRYNVPLFDWKATRNSSGRYNTNRVQRRWSGQYYQDQGGYYFGGNFYQGFWMKSYVGSVSQFGSMAYGTFAQITASNLDDPYNRFLSRDKRLIVWDLPGDDTPIDDAPPLAPNGTKTIRISPTSMKVAKPGYNVDTATPAQLAFDTTRVPVKVIKAADIAIPVGESFYETAIALPDNVALDVHFYTGSTIMYPTNPQQLEFGAEYWFSGSRIYFSATQAMRARFMLYLEDDTPPTSGSFKVFRQFNDGTQDVVQFLRPGAANPPSWADIIIDSRWPAVQILAQGYFNIAAGNGVITDIPFDGAGMFPMVKYITTHGPQSMGNVGSWQNCYKMPYVRMLVYPWQNPPSGGQQNHCGDSTYCELTANNARFRTYLGNISDNYIDNGDREVKRPGVQGPPVGIRYYIFGIPA